MEQNETTQFSAKIEIIGINPFVFVPDAILQIIFQQAGKDKGFIPIKGTINDNPYRQTLVRYSGEWRLYINTIMLKNSPKRIGEIVKLSITFDLESRAFEMPDDFAKALAPNQEANLVFEQLSASRKHEIVRYLARLKNKESLDRNITRAINFLLGKEKFVGSEKP